MNFGHDPELAHNAPGALPVRKDSQVESDVIGTGSQAIRVPSRDPNGPISGERNFTCFVYILCR